MLTVISGPMFAGKSTELINRISKAFNPVVFKPKFDTRYSEDNIVTHDGVSVEAIQLDTPLGDKFSECDIFFDEIQFFDKSFIEWIKKLSETNNIVVAGLDLDWKREPFEMTHTLEGMADEIVKLQSTCYCGQRASYTYKKTQSGSSIELGENDLYEPRCSEHHTF